MKKHILFISLTLLSFFAHAQENVIEDLPYNQFRGLYSEDGRLFYSVNMGNPQTDTPYSYMIHIFNDGFKRIARKRVVSKWGTEFITAAEHNGGLLFYFKHGNDGQLLYFDREGDMKKDMSFERDKPKFNEPMIVSMGDKGFAWLREHKEKKNGVIIEGYDNEFNLKWNQGFYPEKGNIKGEMIRYQNGRLGILNRFSKSLFSTIFEDEIIILDPAGQIKNRAIVGNENNFRHPMEFYINSDGGFFTTGYAYESDDNIKDFFVASFGADGKEKFGKHYSQKDYMENRIKGRHTLGSNNFENTPLINFNEITKTTNGYSIVGETFLFFYTIPQAGSTNPGELIVMDMVIIDVSDQGEIRAINRVKKPYKKVRTTGTFATSYPGVTDYYGDYNYFGYRFPEEVDGKKVYLTWGWNQNLKYTGIVDPTKEREEITTRLYLDPENVNPDNSRGEYTIGEFKKEELGPLLSRYRTNILPYHEKGKVAYYKYTDKKLHIKVVDLNDPSLLTSKDGEQSIKGIPAEGFTGIQSLQNGNYFTTYFSESDEDSMGYFVIHTLDKNLNILNSNPLKLPTGAYLVDKVENKDHFMLIYQDNRRRSWIMFKFDYNGKLLGNNSLSLKPGSELRPNGKLLLQPAGNEGFFMLQPYDKTVEKEKDEFIRLNGYEVISLDGTMNVKWVYSFFGKEYEYVSLLDADAAKGKLAFIQSYQTNENNHFYTVVMLDEKGNVIVEKEIRKDAIKEMPDYLDVAENGNVIVGGPYRIDTEKSRTNPNGMFLMELGSAGSIKYFTTVEWKKLGTIAGIENAPGDLESGKNGVLIQDLIRMPDGSHRLIGEIYSRSSGNTGLGFLLGENVKDRIVNISDFIIYNFNATGNLTSVYKIDKEDQKIEIPEHMSRRQGVSLSYLLRNYGMFSYVTTLKGSDPQVIFTNYEDGQKMVYSTPLKETSGRNYRKSVAEYIRPAVMENDGVDNPFMEISNKLEELDKKIEQKLIDSDRKFSYGKNPYEGLVAANPGDVLVYSYNPVSNSLDMRVIELK